jgi:hypothetical protein
MEDPNHMSYEDMVREAARRSAGGNIAIVYAILALADKVDELNALIKIMCKEKGL